MSNDLLARYASCIFWLARYIERAENLARILDVNETFSRDARGTQNWLSIVQLNADEEGFFKKYSVAKAETVLPFYITDVDNPTSIVSAIQAARENARTLRPLISTEMWVQLNVFHKRLRAIEPREFAPGNLSRLCTEIKESCQTHAGITDGTFYRDQGWYFYRLGRYIERADQTTRLLDIKYHLLLPKQVDVGSLVDVSQWQALLRSAAGYHAFKRLHTDSATPSAVAGFLLHNPRFPRAVALCLREVSTTLTDLKSRFALRGGNEAAERLDHLEAMLASVSITEILANGLHQFVEMVQDQLGVITTSLSEAFFGVTPLTPEAVAEQ